MNRYQFIGNIGNDAEVKNLPGGNVVTNFSVAVSEKWKDANGEKKERTTWISCSIWGEKRQAVAQYLRKGTRVLIEGRPSSRAWINRESGEAHSILEVTVDHVELLSSRNDSTAQPQGATIESPEKKDDDLPF